MTLIIGARCKNGCLVIADKRSHETQNGVKTFRDDFSKVVLVNGWIIYNHGYNRINDEDWKLSAQSLTPDVSNPVYRRVMNEMNLKIDKKAFYVFMNMTELFEITVEVGEPISLHNHMPNDKIVSGNGSKYADISALENLHKKKCSAVRNCMEKTFLLAHYKLKLLNGHEFSKVYEIMRL
jgi:hypothetical protein